MTVRNKKEWLSSMQWMFSERKILWSWDKAIQEFHKEFYGTKKFNRKILSKHWDDYHKDVEQFFEKRPNDLMIINIDKGYNIKEICNFLEIIEKDISVEKHNERTSPTMRQRIKYYTGF